MKIFSSQAMLVLFFSLLLLDGLLLFFWLQGKGVTRVYPEIESLQSKQLSFRNLESYFQNLAQEKGAAYAYEVLKIAPIPPNIDMHLLGHVVGDILYKQEGVNGIKICTNDFRNACSHSIVIGLFNDKGEGALPAIAQACRKAPGGSGAYTMCFHGLGHGILAYLGYDMEKAIEMCKKTGTVEYRNREYIECVGGAVMEIIGGGFHDHELWAKQRVQYLKNDDPLYTCFASFMPKEARVQCLVYLTPHLFEAAGGDLAHPTPNDFEKAFTFCGKIPNDDFSDREACFGGFGKEFVVLAQERDIRKIESMTYRQLSRVYEWCLLAQNKEGVGACLSYALGSLYWGGENDYHVSLRFCEVMNDDEIKSSCYENLIGLANTYRTDSVYQKEFCSEIPNAQKAQCRARLGR